MTGSLEVSVNDEVEKERVTAAYDRSIRIMQDETMETHTIAGKRAWTAAATGD